LHSKHSWRKKAPSSQWFSSPLWTPFNLYFGKEGTEDKGDDDDDDDDDDEEKEEGARMRRKSVSNVALETEFSVTLLLFFNRYTSKSNGGEIYRFPFFDPGRKTSPGRYWYDPV